MDKKVFTLFAILALSAGTLAAAERYAPVAADTVPDKNMVRRILDWVTVFTMYSDVDISDKVDLKQYAEAADLAKSFITNPELSVTLADFRAATFVSVYPKGVVKSDEWIFKKLNEVSDLQYDVMNAPYLSLEVAFTPVDDNTAYSVVPTFKGSPEITQDLSMVNGAMKSSLAARYTTPREAKADVNKAVAEALEKIKILLGSTYAPNIAILYKDELYLDNHSVETWQQAGGTLALQAVDKNGSAMAGAVAWENAQGSGSSATFALDKTGETTVKATSGKNSVRLKIKVKAFDLNIEDILKTILKEVVDDKVKEARDKVEKLLKDTVAVNDSLAMVKTALDASTGMSTASASPTELDKVEDIADMREGTAAELEAIRKDKTKNDYIELHRRKYLLAAQFLLQIKIEDFLKNVIDNDGNMSAYVEAIKSNSPQLVMDLLMNMTKAPENRTQLKDMIVKFLNQQIDEVVSKS